MQQPVFPHFRFPYLSETICFCFEQCWVSEHRPAGKLCSSEKEEWVRLERKWSKKAKMLLGLLGISPELAFCTANSEKISLHMANSEVPLV